MQPFKKNESSKHEPKPTIRGLNIFAMMMMMMSQNPSLEDLCYLCNYLCKRGDDDDAIPGDGEDMIWLSHWKMENETLLQCGDQVVVSVRAGLAKLFRIKEFGVELMQEHQNNMIISTQHNTKSDPNYPCVIGGDLSMYEHKPGMYFLGLDKGFVDYEQRWFNRLIMDSDEEDADKEEGHEDEPDYTIGRTRDAGNNCGLRGWKVLLTAAGLFFMHAVVVRSSISWKKKRQ